jgi:galactonate dehydratase
MREGGQTVANCGLAKERNAYADLDAFLYRADDLAEDLLSEGICGRLGSFRS